MAGYPPPPGPGGTPGYGYGAAPYGAAPYGAPTAQPYAPVATPYGAPSAPYAHTPTPGEKPPKENKYQGYGGAPPQGYGAAPPQGSSGAPPQGYGAAPPQGYGAAPPQGYGTAPPQGYGGAAPQGYGGPATQGSGYPPTAQPYGTPFASLLPSTFPPGTDPNVVACFQVADQDGSGLIDDKELQRALSSYNQSFSIRTVHLLMYLFTNTNTRKIGPKEFTSVFYSLQSWRGIFERFDRDRSGKIDLSELREALMSLGYSVSPTVLDMLVSKYDKSGGQNKAIEYDNFIECCLTVKGLTEKFKEKDTGYTGSATFSYETFMLTVLPFLIA